MDKPGAREMPNVFFIKVKSDYYLGFSKPESESSWIVIKHEGPKEDPKLIPYIFPKITYLL